MRGGRGEFRDQDVTVVLAEHLGLRDVGKRIEVKPVRGRTVRLVARQVPVLTAPVRPNLEARKLRLVNIATILRLCAVVFVAVMVEGTRRHRDEDVRVRRSKAVARHALRRLAKPLVVLRDMKLHCLWVERIEHVALAAKPGALHLHPRARRVLLVDPRPPEAPPSPHREVDAKPVMTCKPCRQVPRLDPLRGKKRFPIFLVATLRAIDRNHVEAAKALVSKLAALILKPGLVDRGAHPPIVGPGFHLPCRLRPEERQCAIRR